MTTAPPRLPTETDKLVDRVKDHLGDGYSVSSLEDEHYREYLVEGDWVKVENPQVLVIRRGGTTHRVLDDKGVVWCFSIKLPFRWKNKNNDIPILF